MSEFAPFNDTDSPDNTNLSDGVDPTKKATVTAALALKVDGSAVIQPASQSGTWTTNSHTQDNSGNGITSSNNGTANNQLLHTQHPDTTTATTVLGALNATIQVTMAGLNSVGFQIATGTLIGTLTPECSIDGGTTWVACTFFDPVNSTVATSIIFGTANTLKVVSVLPIGGSSQVRVRVSVYTSGTANSLMRASSVSGVAGALTAAAFGTITNTYVSLTASTATQILASNVNRKYCYVSNPTGQTVTIQLGSSTGLTGTNRGLVIPSNSVFELKGDNLYTGVIFAFTTSGSVTLSIAEGTP